MDFDKLGSKPISNLSKDEHKNNLPDILTRWNLRESDEHKRTRDDQSFTVNLNELVDKKYTLDFNEYKKFDYVHEKLNSPNEIIGKLKKSEKKIQNSINEMRKEF